MAYCTLAQLKAYEGLDESNTTDDVRLQTFLDAAQAAIDVETGLTFEASANTTREFDCISVAKGGPVDGPLLWLDRPLAAINTITNGDGIAVTSGQYVTQPRNDSPFFAIRLLASSGTVWQYTIDPEGAIAISGKWAYSVAAPADIVLATKRWASWLYRQKDSQGQFDRPTMSPDGTLLMPATAPPDVMKLLKNYKAKL